MPKEQAEELLKRLDEEPELRSVFRAARDLAIEKIIELALEHGHEFTAEELREALHDKWGGEVKFGREPDDLKDPPVSFLSERPGF